MGRETQRHDRPKAQFNEAERKQGARTPPLPWRTQPMSGLRKRRSMSGVVMVSAPTLHAGQVLWLQVCCFCLTEEKQELQSYLN
jgi:hypothetical protein